MVVVLLHKFSMFQRKPYLDSAYHQTAAKGVTHMARVRGRAK